jgi:phosphoserine aminotransferase
MLEMIATSVDKKVCRLGFDLAELPTGLPLIHVTHNDSIQGTQIDPGLFSHIRSKSPESLIAVNLDTSLPYSTITWDELDMAYFSVHHGFGLPAGLAIWVVNERALSMASKLSLPVRGTPDIFQFADAASKHQTPTFQNGLGIYLLGKVANDMLTRGLHIIKKETEYKAALWYNCLKQHPTLSAPAVSRELLSKTTLVCEGASEESVQYLNGKGLIVEPVSAKSQLTFANYPVHSKEQYEYLVDTLAAFG